MTNQQQNNHKASKKFRLVLRTFVLFTNFFLIIMALYNLKPASRSLILGTLGADALPYIWIGSALVLLVAIIAYHHILNRYSRIHVVLGSCLLFIMLLIVFRISLTISTSKFIPVAFYIFVDILSVILVEQFWSLTDSIYSTEEGKSWYGLIGTGGLLGGVAGGGVAALVIKYTPLQTYDLLLIAAAIIGVIFSLTWLMGRLHLYTSDMEVSNPRQLKHRWQILTKSRYLILIAAALMVAQLVSPMVEFQFMHIIEGTYPDLETRTAVLSVFFSILSAISIGVNLLITPIILRYLGVLAGLMVQPLALATSAYGFIIDSSFFPAATMKISDRGLSYSINRASKELLYIPVDPITIYESKAWIDMFGYRIFKVLGATLILFLTQWTTFVSGYAQLSWVIIGGCVLWAIVLLYLHREYQNIRVPITKPNL
jgi:AAA family ATP:ADP antiporter